MHWSYVFLALTSHLDTDMVEAVELKFFEDSRTFLSYGDNNMTADDLET